MNLFWRWLLASIAVAVTTAILPGVSVIGIGTIILTALVLGIINMFLRPILIVLTLPITFLTLGLFTFVINALLVLLTAKIVPGFYVSSFWWALLFSLLLSVVSSFLNMMSEKK